MKKINIHMKPFSEIDFSCGTKATTLLELKSLDLSIPDFYAIPSSCFNEFCQEAQIEIPEMFYARAKYDSHIIKKFDQIEILNTKEITQKLKNDKYMVRSSSVPTKDVDLKTFPSMISGVFESYFASTISDVAENIPKVWKSLYSEKAYNQCRILSDHPIVTGMGVLIQKYIEPVISGVAHTCNDMVSVNWIRGHLSKIVTGEVRGNVINVYLSPECNYILRGTESDILFVKNNDYEDVFKSLFDSITIAKKHFGYEQEMEWIYDGITVWIVQSQTLLTQD